MKTPTPTAIEDHPIAAAFPLLTSEELYALRDNIKEHGLKQSVVLFEEKILDGRNRHRACLAAGVTPHYEHYQGNDPVGFVIGLNINRRHLTTGQRAMIAADLANMKVGGDRRSDHSANLQNDLSQDATAEKLKVSTRSVAEAVQIKKAGVPELQAAVRNGQASIHAAAAVAKLPKRVQRAAVARGREGVVEAAKNGCLGISAECQYDIAWHEFGKALDANTLEAIEKGVIRITEAETIELSQRLPKVIKEAINLMHSNGWPLKRALRVIDQPIDEESKVKELIHLCIGAGGKWEGLFNLDAYRITVEHIKPETAKS